VIASCMFVRASVNEGNAATGSRGEGEATVPFLILNAFFRAGLVTISLPSTNVPDARVLLFVTVMHGDHNEPSCLPNIINIGEFPGRMELLSSSVTAAQNSWFSRVSGDDTTFPAFCAGTTIRGDSLTGLSKFWAVHCCCCCCPWRLGLCSKERVRARPEGVSALSAERPRKSVISNSSASGGAEG
jgi:hypothetical protein